MLARWVKQEMFAGIRGVPFVIRKTWLALLRDEGSEFSEVRAPSYARVEVQLAEVPNEPDVMTNAEFVQFPDAKEDWGKVAGVAVFDAPTQGRFVMLAPIVNPEEINVNNQYGFKAGALRFRIRDAA